MTQKPSKKPVVRPSNPNFRGFLNITLSDEDKAIIKATAYDLSAWATDLDKWVDNGYKFTFSDDSYNHCFQVIGTPQQQGHVDFGIMMTGRGSTAIKAFKQWVYIQTRLIGESSWTDNLKPKQSQEIDD
jgi:hypothetical protein